MVRVQSFRAFDATAGASMRVSSRRGRGGVSAFLISRRVDRAADASMRGGHERAASTPSRDTPRRLEDIRPWCISRQLWWGHRIPAWFAFRKGMISASRGGGCLHAIDATRVHLTMKWEAVRDPRCSAQAKAGTTVDVDAERNKERWIVARSEEQALAQAQKLLGTKDVTLERENVLDTTAPSRYRRASSPGHVVFFFGLFALLGVWLARYTDEFKAFYPTQLLETGLDILFFWVARMVMMGLQLTDKLPFTDVYLHAMVRDKDGRKCRNL